MNKGEPVEVNKIWASNGRFQPPSRDWFKGYTFESTDGATTKVRATKGVYEGCVINYPAKDVRPEVHSDPRADVVSA